MRESLNCGAGAGKSVVLAWSLKRKSPMFGQSELRSCVKVEVDVLGSPSLTVLTVSVDVKQNLKNE